MVQLKYHPLHGALLFCLCSLVFSHFLRCQFTFRSSQFNVLTMCTYSHPTQRHLNSPKFFQFVPLQVHFPSVWILNHTSYTIQIFTQLVCKSCMLLTYLESGNSGLAQSNWLLTPPFTPKRKEKLREVKKGEYLNVSL